MWWLYVNPRKVPISVYTEVVSNHENWILNAKAIQHPNRRTHTAISTKMLKHWSCVEVSISWSCTFLLLDQSVCDVPPSCFTRSDDLYNLEKLKKSRFSQWCLVQIHTAATPLSQTVKWNTVKHEHFEYEVHVIPVFTCYFAYGHVSGSCCHIKCK